MAGNNWKSVSLSTVADVVNGFAFKSDEYTNSGHRVIRITNVQKGEIVDKNPQYIDSERISEFAQYELFRNDLLISLTGNVGRVGILPESLVPALLNQRVGCIRPKTEKIDLRFLFHILNTERFERECINNSNGIAQLNLSSRWIESYLIPLPPLDEQKRIAAILDSADAIRTKRKAAIAKIDELAQSIFLDMFGDPTLNTKGIKIVNLSDVTLKITDGVHQKPNYTEKGIPFISVKDITTGTLSFADCKYISEADHKGFSKRCCPELFDILYTKVGATYGRPAIVNSEQQFSLYVSVCLIKPNKKVINPFYLNATLALPAIKKQADKRIKGIGVPDLHLDQIKQFLIPLPTMAEQEKFANHIAELKNLYAYHLKALMNDDALFSSLQQRAFSGEL